MSAGLNSIPPVKPSLLVSVGDLSGDRHAARVISEIKKLAPELAIWGLGGPEMAGQGVELLHNCQDFATVGIIEPIRLLPFFARIRSELIRSIKNRKPAAVLLVDFGGFNIGLAQLIRPKFPDLPIIYFISPQVWGSRPWRVQVLKRCISKMLTIFPFEESLYREHGVPARFVGHPLGKSLSSQTESREAFCSRHGLNPEQPIVGVFPGSRRREISELMPVVLQAADWLLKQRPEIQFVISRANQVLADSLESVLDRQGYRKLLGNGVTLLPVGDSRPLMSVSDILWTKSGTTTLEAALASKPMLIFYRANWLSYWIFLLFKQVKHVGWPNLLAGKSVVPELIQLDCRAEQIVRYTADWLDVPAAREAISLSLQEIRGRLGEGNFAQNAASEILEMLKHQRIET